MYYDYTTAVPFAEGESLYFVSKLAQTSFGRILPPPSPEEVPVSPFEGEYNCQLKTFEAEKLPIIAVKMENHNIFAIFRPFTG